MLANTLTVTISGAPKILTRISEQSGASKYQLKTAADIITLQVRQTVEPKSAKNPQVIARANLFLEHLVYATPTASQKYYSASTVIRYAETSDPAYCGALVTGFNALLGTISTQMIGGEV